MQRVVKAVGIFFLGCVALTLVSCQSTYVTSGKNTYELKPAASLMYYMVDLTQKIEDVHKASVKGLKDLGIEAPEGKYDKLVGMVSGKLADGKVIQIKLSVTETGGTQMRIHVGKMSDKDKSTAIFRAIEKHL